VFLTFDGTVSAGEPFAHMVPNNRLSAVLRSAAEAAGIRLTAPETVSGFAAKPGYMEVTLGSGEARRPKLLVAADGVRSQLRKQAGIRTVEWTYPQTAIVATVRHARPHNGVAVEHFLPGGPFAILPLTGNRSSLVWTEPTENAKRLMESDDFVFLPNWSGRFGYRLGAARGSGAAASLPAWAHAGARFRADPAVRRCSAMRRTASTRSPARASISAFAMPRRWPKPVVDASPARPRPRYADVLRRYERWRRYDTVADGRHHRSPEPLFSNDFSPLRAARDIGLGLGRTACRG
jgi:2-octaprenyl-6-methoxyphenol hydroxylase